MKTGAIDATRIQSMLAQLKAAAQKPAAGAGDVTAPQGASAKVDFAAALKASLAHVNQTQVDADAQAQRFVLGDDKVSLSDVMIAQQKANITFQTTVQVRNKLVSAYQDVMNMPV